MILKSMDWDEYGEPVVATDLCVYCGEPINQWQARVEPDVDGRRPVLLWKHHPDGAVLCGPTTPALPVVWLGQIHRVRNHLPGTGARLKTPGSAQ